MTCAATSGPATAKLAVLGEAPYPGETEPFTAGPGAWLREQLAAAGINPSKLTFSYCVSSTPASPGDEVFPALEYRAPTVEEVQAESVERDARLAATSARFVLLVGNVPLQAYRDDLTIGLAHGHPFCRSDFAFDETVLFPIFHPDGVLRDPMWVPTLQADLQRLLSIGRDPDNWDVYIPDTCVVCGEEGSIPDPQLVTYCADHFRSRHV